MQVEDWPNLGVHRIGTKMLEQPANRIALDGSLIASLPLAELGFGRRVGPCI